MMTFEETVRKLKIWHKDCVGYAILYSPPRMSTIDGFIEETVKLHEMEDWEREAVLKIFDVFEFEKAELFRDKEGNPDRVKISRSL